MGDKKYRDLYKKYYNIDFDSSYEIHHIDFDRNNNDISNLLLLPKDLHSKYHTLLQRIDCKNYKSGYFLFNIKINPYFGIFGTSTVEDVLEFYKVLEDCREWAIKKQFMDLKIKFWGEI